MQNGYITALDVQDIKCPEELKKLSESGQLSAFAQKWIDRRLQQINQNRQASKK